MFEQFASSLFLLAEDPSPLGPLGGALPFLIIGLLFWVLLIRPESRKNADMAKMRDGLKKNDRVITAGGLFGTVVNVQAGAKDVTLRIDENNNTRIRVLKSAIAQIIKGDENSEASKSDD